MACDLAATQLRFEGRSRKLTLIAPRLRRCRYGSRRCKVTSVQRFAS